jgi:hypothetical protein
MSEPPTGTTGFYWTVRVDAEGFDPERPQVRLWSGYSWLEAGHYPHIAPEACRAIGGELEPPEDVA